MAKLKFGVHPLFILFGIYFAFRGKVFSFIVFTLTAVLHEIGHSLVAGSLGYELKRITLMPYGAVVRGEIKDMVYKDEVAISLAGPFVNLFVAIGFVCFWWLVPNSYPYTEICVLANLTLATVNLLPFYPLDGGRVLLAIISCYVKRKTAIKICKIIGLSGSAILIGLFVYSVAINLTNFSILFFASFIAFGNIFVNRDNVYKRITSCFFLGNLDKAKKVNVLAINENYTVKRLIESFTYGELLECYVYDEKGRLIADVKPETVLKILSNFSVCDKVMDVYKKLR